MTTALMVKLLQLGRTPVISLAVFGVSVQPTIRMFPDYAAPVWGTSVASRWLPPPET